MRTNLTDTGAVTTAISVADFKTFARVFHTQDDTALVDMVLAATQVIENETRRALITRAFTYSLEAFPTDGEITLPRSPWIAVSSITYTDAAGATQTLSASAYNAFSVNGIGRVILKASQSWPSTLGDGALDVDVNFTAGYGAAAANIPRALVHACLLQCSHMYDNRASVNIGNIVTEIPMTVRRLIVQYQDGGYW
jgi:uncharacterized phiE125 gp8 family phage protein